MINLHETFLVRYSPLETSGDLIFQGLLQPNSLKIRFKFPMSGHLSSSSVFFLSPFFFFLFFICYLPRLLISSLWKKTLTISNFSCLDYFIVPEDNLNRFCILTVLVLGQGWNAFTQNKWFLVFYLLYSTKILNQGVFQILCQSSGTIFHKKRYVDSLEYMFP